MTNRPILVKSNCYQETSAASNDDQSTTPGTNWTGPAVAERRATTQWNGTKSPVY